ncbi:DUF905 family protein [Enterobacter sp. UPMP2061]|uniref:DUF905 superfamily protein n=1 Tax=Enterobacter cloacae subsp. cloacae TaxID=336306 RepID=A0A217EVW9_ENTCL|nr:DUF905 superfamily protein [Enterobacter cloacae subsp. cloacae]
MGKTLREFLNQPMLLREPTAEETELAALLNGSTVTAPVVLPQGPFTREEATALTAQYTNVSIDNDQGTYFQLVVRGEEGLLTKCAWNFENDVGALLNRALASYRARKQQ